MKKLNIHTDIALGLVVQANREPSQLNCVVHPAQQGASDTEHPMQRMGLTVGDLEKFLARPTLNELNQMTRPART